MERDAAVAANPVIEWVTDGHACFLLGAGCSIPAGKPSIDKLTSSVVSTLPQAGKDLFANLEGTNGRGATVEDVLNHLIQIKKLLSSRKTKVDKDWDLKKCEDTIQAVLRSIVKEIGGQWESSKPHEAFLRRLAAHSERRVCDVFTLNYDVVLEASLEAIRLPYLDGFRGAENAYFDVRAFESLSPNGTTVRLHKLHGSITWIRDADGSVRRRPFDPKAGHDRYVIYPSEQKYVQTQYGVYEQLLTRFRARLREQLPNNSLIILGYSLSDDHINAAILDALQSEEGKLTAYAFVGAEKDKDAQLTRLKALVGESNQRLNILVGQEAFLGTALEPSQWDALKSLDLWRFEKLAELMSGGA